MSKVFIYEGTEVIKTGRKASKIVKLVGRNRVMELEEIKPVDQSIEWKKWVDPEQLFIIHTDE